MSRQLLVNDTHKRQQLIALIVQGFPELADGRILLIFSLLKFAHDKVKEFLAHRQRWPR